MQGITLPSVSFATCVGIVASFPAGVGMPAVTVAAAVVVVVVVVEVVVVVVVVVIVVIVVRQRATLNWPGRPYLSRRR